MTYTWSLWRRAWGRLDRVKRTLLNGKKRGGIAGLVHKNRWVWYGKLPEQYLKYGRSDQMYATCQSQIPGVKS